MLAIATNSAHWAQRLLIGMAMWVAENHAA
jgi:hypothetical protein